ncbi:hypothetical protein U1Q18_050628 [Sarracenia purpurea var. burkii]
MENEERRRKFHESLLNMLYPPPSSPPHITQGRDEEERVNLLRDCLNVDHISEESGSSSSSDDDEGECGSQKLTRAQRKRLRKRKLKRASSHRRKIIGPLLPTNSDDGVVDLRNEAQGVRCNVAEKSDIGNDKPGKRIDIKTVTVAVTPKGWLENLSFLTLQQQSKVSSC